MRNTTETEHHRIHDRILHSPTRPLCGKREVRMVPGARRLNNRATMERYLARMATHPAEWFKELEGSYLCTYAISGGTITSDERTAVQIQRRCPAWHLMRYARSIGVNVLGVTSERKEGGQYISDTRRNPDNKVVYVDRHAYFGSNTASKYCEQQCDHVYYTDDEPISVEALCVPI